jgi:hypothetical protein
MLFGSLLTALTTLGLNYLLRKRPAAGALRIILLTLGGAHSVCGDCGTGSRRQLRRSRSICSSRSPRPLEWPRRGRISRHRWRPHRFAGFCLDLAPGEASADLSLGRSFPSRLKYLKMSSHWLIWISALAWLLASVLVRMDYAARAPAKRRSSVNQQSHLRQIFTVPLVRWMILGTAGIIWTGALVQYESNAAMKDAWPQETINSVTSVLLAVASIGGFATQTLGDDSGPGALGCRAGTRDLASDDRCLHERLLLCHHRRALDGGSVGVGHRRGAVPR